MSITLGIAIDNQLIHEDNYVILEDDLINYLALLTSFDGIQLLTSLDPYNDTLLPTAKLNPLTTELTELIQLAKHHKLPTPPDYIGLQDNQPITIGDSFGWEGLLIFLHDLNTLLKEKKPLLAIGD